MSNLSFHWQIRDEIIANYRERHSQPNSGGLCEEDLRLLRNWRWDYNMTSNYEKYLTTQGWNELKLLGASYRRAFPNLLNGIHDHYKYLFRHTDTQQTEASYKAFAEGLFGEMGYRSIEPEVTMSRNDPLLRVSSL